jgi:hypothetical protein
LGFLTFSAKPKFRKGFKFLLAYTLSVVTTLYLCIIFGLPSLIAVVVISGLSPMIIRTLPYFSIQVNESLLLDYSISPPPLEVVRPTVISEKTQILDKDRAILLYNRSSFAYKAAIYTLSITCLLSTMAILTIYSAHSLFSLFPIILSAVFMLMSRTVAGQAQKNMIQLMSILLILEFFFYAQCPRPEKFIVVVAIIVLALIYLITSLIVKNDSYSIGLSRFGDILEFILIIAVIPYGFFTAGLIDIFRDLVI